MYTLKKLKENQKESERENKKRPEKLAVDVQDRRVIHPSEHLSIHIVDNPSSTHSLVYRVTIVTIQVDVI